MRRTAHALIALVLSLPASRASADVRQFADAAVHDLGLDPRRCSFLSIEEQRDMVDVCAFVGEPFREFSGRWDRIVASSGAHPVDGWKSRKTTAFHGDKTTAFYRWYELDGERLVVLFDKRNESIMIAHAPGHECQDQEASVDGPAPELAGQGDVGDPRRVEYVAPEYPWLALFMRAEGKVVVQLVIDEDGTVPSLCVLHSSTPGMGMEGAAIAAIEQWLYEPALKNGKPVAVYFTLLVSYDR